MSNFSKLWFQGYFIILIIYSAAYIANVSFVNHLGLPIVVFVTGVIIHKSLTIRNMRIPKEISSAVVFSALLFLIYLIKFITQGHYSHLDLATKIILYQLVFISGLFCARVEIPRKNHAHRPYELAIFYLPIVLFILFKIAGMESNVLSFFNRNSFAGYILASSTILLGALSHRTPMKIEVYFVLTLTILAINSTAGALLAFLLSYTIFCIANSTHRTRTALRFLSGATFIIVAAIVLAYSNSDFLRLEIVKKIVFNYQLFVNLIFNYHGSWLDLTMGSAYSYAPGGDIYMSGLFRLIHWISIIKAWVDEGLIVVVFGGGFGWVDLSESKFIFPRVAHNDYIRILVEQGVILAIVSIIAMLRTVFTLVRHEVFIPIMAVVIYFGSESLLNNFISTALFFFILGYCYSMKKYLGCPIRKRLVSKNKTSRLHQR